MTRLILKGYRERRFKLGRWGLVLYATNNENQYGLLDVTKSWSIHARLERDGA